MKYGNYCIRQNIVLKQRGLKFTFKPKCTIPPWKRVVQKLKSLMVNKVGMIIQKHLKIVLFVIIKQ